MSPLHDLKEQTRLAQGLLQTFANILVDDEQAAADMVEGETDLAAAIEMAVHRIASIDAMDTTLALMGERIAARRSRLNAQGDSLRTAITIALEATNTKRLELPFATVSRRVVPPKAQVITESEIPTQFWKRPDPKVDMRALLAALKEGPVPGAELSNGSETISIKWS
mgnify:CR=1 FL=1